VAVGVGVVVGEGSAVSVGTSVGVGALPHATISISNATAARLTFMLPPSRPPFPLRAGPVMIAGDAMV